MKLIEEDLRPPVWIGHVVMETSRLEETASFMRKLGMRPIVQRPEVAVLELRGGTHLVLLANANVTASDARFDLMVEDLNATHKQFVELGLDPTPIERISPEHEGFKVREPSGNVITFYSNHVSGQPV
jgi:catechol 2,3-dioxygenase-like lactoylglutathione lyase family enzyme